MLAVEKHRAKFLAPLGIGMSLFMAEMAGVYYTGGSLNPARSLGPAVANVAFDQQWVYWVGPPLGAILAVGFYSFVKMMRYEEANPGQDGDFEGQALLMDEKNLTTRPGLLRFNNSFGRPLSIPESVFDSRRSSPRR